MTLGAGKAVKDLQRRMCTSTLGLVGHRRRDRWRGWWGMCVLSSLGGGEEEGDKTCERKGRSHLAAPLPAPLKKMRAACMHRPSVTTQSPSSTLPPQPYDWCSNTMCVAANMHLCAGNGDPGPRTHWWPPCPTSRPATLLQHSWDPSALHLRQQQQWQQRSLRHSLPLLINRYPAAQHPWQSCTAETACTARVSPPAVSEPNGTQLLWE
jgi:hypothetical protein